MDLRSDYEQANSIASILSLIVEPSSEPLVGHDGTKYYHYCVLKK